VRFSLSHKGSPTNCRRSVVGYALCTRNVVLISEYVPAKKESRRLSKCHKSGLGALLTAALGKSPKDGAAQFPESAERV
jgi:hypothetical protein